MLNRNGQNYCRDTATFSLLGKRSEQKRCISSIFGKSLKSYSRDYITVSTRSEVLPQTNKVKLMCKKCEAPFELLVKGYFLYLVQGSQIVL